MNLPNKLTLLRVFMIPFFIFFMLFQPDSAIYRVIALVIFCIASLTDMLDGKIARKYHLVTNFGKFMDPLADKLLVCSAMICLLSIGQLPTIAVIIIVAREFIISGFRLIASDNGVVIAASWWGKTKTVSQMAMVIVLIIAPVFQNQMFDLLGLVLIYVATALTVISLIDYLVKNKDVLKEQK
ncbi:MAG TPA: CDP-diacylglycerol--glycerol-3-phosphate 3-phosphatidyltransferase [Lachnospiraceae bacterium]|jgi:CDP-diacylglycerol--glycerol-3-phosphate 3-phosphatidyltransferase|nr:CDP-diacylglycerol--glycerol-3-phosphate 3-phosphatidyltransferase [Lachnospiraceae bacterium]HAN51003.1 CDP-diacylglycerol--glycerol-3-phosphate 3-phosphatidyltransferase [Lachnospiraceae bacterium]HBE08432.1 CDP-diacylglycerol--glycerol-3-phosphate 3-phosphatidyltransferase [Lachnospiraceae bacterium]